MTELLLASQIALWIFALVLGLAVLAIARQLGYVLLRTGPLGGAAITDEGPPVGSRITPVDIAASIGAVQIPDRSGRDTLLVFVSQSCAACADLIPAIKTFAVSRRDDLGVVLATVPNAKSLTEEFLQSLAEVQIPYVLEPSVAEEMNVRGFPYAVVISRDGVTKNKGIVNNIVQLESLLETSPIVAEEHYAHPAPTDHIQISDVATGRTDVTGAP